MVLYNLPGTMQLGRSMPVALIKDKVTVVMIKEVVGRINAHIKIEGWRVDKLRSFSKSESRGWTPIDRLRDNDG